MKTVIFMIVIGLLSSCSINRLVVRQMTPVLQKSAEALYEESDLQLADQALASNLKLLEGMLKSDPQNTEILLLLSQAYAGYALGFAEDSNPQRAKGFYLRARDYALSALRQDTDFQNAEKKGMEEFKEYLKGANKERVPGLFWSAFAWAGYINLSLDEPRALLDLARVQLMMDRVEKLWPGYFHGAVYLFQGSVWGMKPRMLGGDPQKALNYFEKNLKLTKGHFLLTYIYMARFYAAQTLNEELFDSYLKKVGDTSVDIEKDLTLFNAIAKKKAKLLKAQKDDLF